MKVIEDCVVMQGISGKLLTNIEDVLAKDSNGDTSLSKIIRNGDVELIKSSLEYLKNLDASLDRSGYTALHLSVDLGQYDIVKFLLKSGASVEARTTRKDTPLHTAALNGNLVMIDILMDNGADINARNILDSTPLHMACQIENNIYCVRKILEFGPDMNTCDNFGYTPLINLIWNGIHMEDLCDIILTADVNPNLSDNYGENSLHHLAYYKGNDVDLKAIAEILLNKGACIHSKNVLGETPLHSALREGKLTLVDFLFENGAHINVVDRKGMSMMKYISHNCHRSKNISKPLFIRHMTLRISNKYSVTRRIKNYINGREDLKIYQSQCESELSRLKNIAIEKTVLNVWDLLVCNMQRLSEYTRNYHVVRALKNCIQHFPIYGPYIERRLEEAIRKRDEELCTMEIVNDFCGGKLPLLPIRLITQHISSTNRKILIGKYIFP